MTPALKAMVKAMAAEIVRQGNEEKSRGTAVWYPSDPTNPADVRSISLDGNIDLEKVARAGLEAIPNAALASGVAAAFYEVGGTADDGGWETPSPDAALAAMLDAILSDAAQPLPIDN